MDGAEVRAVGPVILTLKGPRDLSTRKGRGVACAARVVANVPGGANGRPGG